MFRGFPYSSIISRTSTELITQRSLVQIQPPQPQSPQDSKILGALLFWPGRRAAVTTGFPAGLPGFPLAYRVSRWQSRFQQRGLDVLRAGDAVAVEHGPRLVARHRHDHPLRGAVVYAVPRGGPSEVVHPPSEFAPSSLLVHHSV